MRFRIAGKIWLSFGTLREPDLLLIGESVGGVAMGSASEEASHHDSDLIKVRILRSYAHPNGILHYRIDWRDKSLVYATDTEGYVNGDQRLARFARNTNLLIHDAQYTDEHYLGLAPGLPTTQGYGHSTTKIACQSARAAEAENLILFHHAPEYDDDELDRINDQVHTLHPPVQVAREGMRIALIEPETRQEQDVMSESMSQKVLSV